MPGKASTSGIFVAEVVLIEPPRHHSGLWRHSWIFSEALAERQYPGLSRTVVTVTPTPSHIMPVAQGLHLPSAFSYLPFSHTHSVAPVAEVSPSPSEAHETHSSIDAFGACFPASQSMHPVA